MDSMPSDICPLCSEPVAPDGDAEPVGMSEGPDHDPQQGRAHRECLLRVVVGGIGHFEDHERWCVREGDPDGGRTYRQSALEVDEWYAALNQ